MRKRGAKISPKGSERENAATRLLGSFFGRGKHTIYGEQPERQYRAYQPNVGSIAHGGHSNLRERARRLFKPGPERREWLAEQRRKEQA